MDPNTCFSRIMDAVSKGNEDEFVSAFAELSDWLEKGGFPPTVNSLGEARYVVGDFKYELKPRRWLSDRPFVTIGNYHVIMTENPNGEAPFIFVIYTQRGDELRRFHLPRG